MKKSTKITVFLTSYNHGKYLRESINSVLNQSYTNFDLIIVDDASSDESWGIIQSYSDSRIQAYQSTVQSNHEYTNKKFADIPKNEYIAILHSDDAWEPRKLEKQVDFLDSHPEIGAVFTWAQIIDDDGQPFQDENHFYSRVFEQPNRSRHQWLNHFFYTGNALCHPSVLIRKKCYEDVGLYRHGFAQLPDLDMWVRLCLRYEIHILQEKLVRFRVRAGELNSSGNKPETHIRVHFELLHLYANYLEIDSREDFLETFPDMGEYLKKEPYDLKFTLAMVMLKPETNRIAKLFGLNVLYYLLNDPAAAPTIKDAYNFGHSEFVNLTAQHDVFSVRAIQDLNQQLIEKELRVAELSSNLQAITQSRAWKLASRLQKFWNKFKLITKRSRLNN